MNTATTTADNISQTPPFLKGMLTSRSWRGRPYLISPVIDFLMVGGAAYIVGALLMFLVSQDLTSGAIYQGQANISGFWLSILAAILAYHVFFVNYPHFAFSYQLMYRDFGKKVRGQELPRHMQMRYIFAGVVVPIVFVYYYSTTVLQGDLVALGYVVNVMFLLVGWHYAKQSFGVMVVLHGLKGIYFGKWQRRLLLTNIYLVWITTWVLSNFSAYESQFWGVPYSSIMLPALLPSFLDDYWLFQNTLHTACWIFFGATVLMLLAKATQEKRWLSFTGLVGYSTLYSYLLVVHYVHPLWLFFVPAFHSLQYMLFVIAFKRNESELKHKEAAGEYTQKTAKRAAYGFLAFAAIGGLIGAMQFEWAPRLLDYLIDDAHTLAIPTLFLAMFHLFVNIHHYFIDNVIWRKDNPEVGRYLMIRH
ncbi:MAG: hypothetical protein CMM94_04945 [Rickettsiales bacterium]|nr:hypothetical protein [Rickettsiales bacterium]